MVEARVTEINLRFRNSGTRRQVRKRLARIFLRERCGNGIGDSNSQYIYYVENLSNGARIFLDRSAGHNLGFDFCIKIKSPLPPAKKGQKLKPPPINVLNHSDIEDDLLKKKAKNPQLYAELYSLIKAIYHCRNIKPQQYANLTFKVGYPVDIILGIIKWIFIQQDFHNWNWGGRSIFMSELPQP